MSAEKVSANEIKKKLLVWAKGGYDVLLPNFFFGYNECDLFRITQSDYVFEYEIKISRADFFADFKKKTFGTLKHDDLKAGVGGYVPNRFFFVVPEGLVKISEVPPYAGLIYYGSSLTQVKTAKLLHKNKFTNFRSICHTLADRDYAARSKLERHKTGSFEREISRLKADNEGYKRLLKEANQELWMLKVNRRHIEKQKLEVSDTTADAIENNS